MTRSTLQFVKLGGSLITDKEQPRSPRVDILARLVEEIDAALRKDPSMRLLLGHGSGSFGHVPANTYQTRQGVHTPADWRGFAEVWREAAALNHIVMDALARAGLQAVAFPPSASVTAEQGMVAAWNIQPIQAALQAGLLPVVYGDVVFDRKLGGTILSTEDLFSYLAKLLRPRRILLAGIEQGVWADFPACTSLIPDISPENWDQVLPALAGSHATDVTGGMASKARQSLDLVQAVTGLEVLIFSGLQAGNLEHALAGDNMGTHIRPSRE